MGSSGKTPTACHRQPVATGFPPHLTGRIVSIPRPGCQSPTPGESGKRGWIFPRQPGQIIPLPDFCVVDWMVERIGTWLKRHLRKTLVCEHHPG